MIKKTIQIVRALHIKYMMRENTGAWKEMMVALQAIMKAKMHMRPVPSRHRFLLMDTAFHQPA